MQRLWTGVAAGCVALVAFAARAESPLERGTYLMHSIVACGNCHTPKGPNGELPGMELAGGFKVTDEAFVAVVPNITPDPETGIGKWTDAQIITAIREGKRPDGSIIGPPMPIGMYKNMSDSDVKAIVAYLRQVKPVKNAVGKSEYKIPLPPSYGPPVTSVAEVPRNDKLRHGAYLAGPLGHCMECHTKLVNGVPDLEHRAGAGGNKFEGPFGISISRNITPDQTHGIGKWTLAEFKTALGSGVRPNGEQLKPPMGFGYYKNISDEDFEAIWTYLGSLKPLDGP